MLEIIKTWDTQLFVFLNGINSPFFDQLMWWFSGKFFWIPMYLLIIACIIYKQRWKAIITLLFIVFVVTLADQISVHAFKEVFQRLRPCHNPELADVVHLVNNKCGGKYGFVSSHAANTFAVAFFLKKLLAKKYFSLFIISWAIIVSYSRIYLGVHYPLDIVGGALLGTGIGLCVFSLYRYTSEKLAKQI